MTDNKAVIWIRIVFIIEQVYYNLSVFLSHIWSYDGVYIDGVVSFSTHVDVFPVVRGTIGISAPSTAPRQLGNRATRKKLFFVAPYPQGWLEI